MKVLHISHLYYPSLGGNQYHAQIVSEKLAALGEEVHVFTAKATRMEHFEFSDPSLNDLPEEELINGVHVHRFKVNYKLIDLVSTQRKNKIRGIYRLFKLFTKEAYDIWLRGPVTLGMLIAIVRLKPDVILTTNYLFFGTYICYLVRKLFKIPFVIMPTTHMADPWARNPLIKKFYDQADLLIACTDFEKKHIASMGYENKVVTLPLAIDPRIFHGITQGNIKKKYGLGNGPIVAYVGRKVPGKGIEALIDSMWDVWTRYPDAQLVLAGQTTDHFAPVIQKHVNNYTARQQEHIICIDNLSEEEKVDLYQVIDIMAMPSNTDCFGLVYLEAWASSKPVIACRKTPQESIVRDGIDGLLVDYNKKEQLTEAILKLFKDEDLRLKMGRNGRDMVQTKYNLNTYCIHLQEIYHTVLKKPMEEIVEPFEPSMEYLFPAQVSLISPQEISLQTYAMSENSK